MKKSIKLILIAVSIIWLILAVWLTYNLCVNVHCKEVFVVKENFSPVKNSCRCSMQSTIGMFLTLSIPALIMLAIVLINNLKTRA